MAAIEAPVLAALATETPLLLIGPHGTAKSLLLLRVAAALGLEFRHYNASLLNFDDLVGFPLPGPDGDLRYARTPAAIWGAGAVFFDEISRCRPDVQNKLFPILHERRVQGLPLDGLRHRWAAMNPPVGSGEVGGGGDLDYLGSEPLDAALADRFGFVVEMPAWSDLTRAQQLSVIQAEDAPIEEDAARALRIAIDDVRGKLAAQSPDRTAAIADYVHAITGLLAQAGLPTSPRRANMLWRGARAVLAAQRVLDPCAPIGDALLAAVCSGLPQRAEGVPVSHAKVLAAHREALHTITLEADDPLREILSAEAPLDRLRLALRADALPDAEFANIVTDVLNQLAPGARESAIAHLFATGAAGRLHAAVASELSVDYSQFASPLHFIDDVRTDSARFAVWSRIRDLLATLDPDDQCDNLLANTIASLYENDQFARPEDAEQAFSAFQETWLLLRAS